MLQTLAELPDEAFSLPADPDEAVLRVTAEGWLLAEKFDCAAASAQPDLASRCTAAATALRIALT